MLAITRVPRVHGEVLLTAVVSGCRILPILLRDYPGEIIRLSCEKCERSGQYRKQKLIERYGADIPLHRPRRNSRRNFLSLIAPSRGCRRAGHYRCPTCNVAMWMTQVDHFGSADKLLGLGWSTTRLALSFGGAG